jgi:crotonobetainyl-CoA:carnitine CoA-transferase CaiB-like acyl-CoA transferase
LYDALAPLLGPLEHGVTTSGGLLGGGLPAYGLYEAREGRIAVAALEPRFRERLYEELQLPVDSSLAATFRTRTADDWEHWARDRDLPIAAVRRGRV